MGERSGLTRQELTGSIIGAFYEVYNGLGFGLLESVYAAALALELSARGHLVEREVWLTSTTRGNRLPANGSTLLSTER